jgi:hypothetical protein
LDSALLQTRQKEYFKVLFLLEAQLSFNYNGIELVSSEVFAHLNGHDLTLDQEI